MSAATISHDEALLWLRDRLGKIVDVAVKMERDGYSVDVLSTAGTLRDWREEHGGAWAGVPREDIIGFFIIGGLSSFDLSDLGECEFALNEWDDSLHVLLGEDIWLQITEVNRTA